MGVLISVIIFLIILLGGAIYIIKNLLKKNESYEDFILNLRNNIEFMNNKLEEIDHSGHFRADDEVGYFFKELKNIMNILKTYFTSST